MINPATGHDVEELRRSRALGLRVGEGVGHADAVNRVLLEAIDDAWRLDLGQFVNRRCDVDHVMELRPRGRISLDAFWPGNRHRVTRAAEIGTHQLGALIRRAARPGPAGVVHVVGFRAAERRQAAEFIERLEMLRNRRRNAVLRQLLADRAIQPFGRRTVVAPDVKDQRVVQLALALDLVDHPSRVVVSVFGKAGKDFHQAALEWFFGFRNRLPGGHRSRARRQLGVLRNPALGLGVLEGTLAIGIPARIELALVFVRPFLHHLMRPVRSARRPVHQEGFVRRVGILLAQPLDGIGRDVVGEVVTLRLVIGHRRGVAGQGRLVLRSFTGQESVEILKAIAGRPVIEWPLGSDLLFRRVVPLAPGPGVVAVVLEHFGDGGR